MARGRKQKNAAEMPPPTLGVLRITSGEGAKGQLETAIELWFDKRDASSIHTLAVAAQGMLEEMCRDEGIEMSELEADTKSRAELYQELLRGPQNFFKHGRHKQNYKGVVSLYPYHSELIMMDCVSMYERLFGSVTPLMGAYGKKIQPKLEEIKKQEPSED